MRRFAFAAIGLALTAAPAFAEEGRVLRDRPTSKGAGAGQTIDLYLCDEGKAAPLMIFVHGGGWRIGDKKRVQLKPAAFNERGYHFASLNYRLEVGFREQAQDVADGVAWAAARMKKAGASAPIFIMGHSAGAHLAALIATDPRYLKKRGLGTDALAGVVLLDGAGYDIPRHIAESGPRARRLYTTVFGEDPKEQAAASPARQVARAGVKPPPFLIIHVARRADSRAQSHLLAKRLKAAGGEARVVPAEGKTHGSLNKELGAKGDAPTREVFRFLKRRAAGSTRDKTAY